MAAAVHGLVECWVAAAVGRVAVGMAVLWLYYAKSDGVSHSSSDLLPAPLLLALSTISLDLFHKTFSFAQHCCRVWRNPCHSNSSTIHTNTASLHMAHDNRR